MSQDEDRSRVVVAASIKAVYENWAAELEIIRLKVRVSKARYDALRKEGFDVSQSLALCTKQVEL